MGLGLYPFSLYSLKERANMRLKYTVIHGLLPKHVKIWSSTDIFIIEIRLSILKGIRFPIYMNIGELFSTTTIYIEDSYKCI